MVRSRFGMAPQGNGLHSFRLAEVMSAGTVPVVVIKDPTYFAEGSLEARVLAEDHFFVLPYFDTLDWTKFSFYITSDELPNMIDRLEAVSTEVLYTQR